MYVLHIISEYNCTSSLWSDFPRGSASLYEHSRVRLYFTFRSSLMHTAQWVCVNFAPFCVCTPCMVKMHSWRRVNDIRDCWCNDRNSISINVRGVDGPERFGPPGPRSIKANNTVISLVKKEMLLHATLATLVLKNQTPINFVMQPPDYWTGSLCFPKGREFACKPPAISGRVSKVISLAS